ncbi:hypothetical protein GCM10010272_66170 [Streptomyces lateritius]|nr:hypothetical protein GCM10010272_66170 [Streptomyces lateritius]
MGYELEFATDHNSGQLRNGDGPCVFIAEVPEDREPHTRVVLRVADADAFRPDPAFEVVTPFEDIHYGTKEMTVRDPDGRLWTLQAPARTDHGEGEHHGRRTGRGTGQHRGADGPVAGDACPGRPVSARSRGRDRPASSCPRR